MPIASGKVVKIEENLMFTAHTPPRGAPNPIRSGKEPYYELTLQGGAKFNVTLAIGQIIAGWGLGTMVSVDNPKGNLVFERIDPPIVPNLGGNKKPTKKKSVKRAKK